MAAPVRRGRRTRPRRPVGVDVARAHTGAEAERHGDLRRMALPSLLTGKPGCARRRGRTSVAVLLRDPRRAQRRRLQLPAAREVALALRRERRREGGVARGRHDRARGRAGGLARLRSVVGPGARFTHRRRAGATEAARGV